MNAIGLIIKDKNNLFFQGIMNIKSPKLSGKDTSRLLKETIRQKRAQINSKQHELVGMSVKVI